jgi:hypothetical protein
MKIHGRRFDEVYAVLPLPFRALIVVSAAFVLFVLIHIGRLAFQHDRRQDPGPITFTDVLSYSGYDPALAEGPAGRVVMAFSNIQSVTGKSEGLTRSAPGISLAIAEKGCSAWRPLPQKTGLLPMEDAIVAPDGQTTIATGVWRYETPALVFDPSDPDPARAWKVYAYKYIWTRDGNLGATQRYNVIVARYAADPEKEWSTEEWIFGAKDEYPPQPYQSMVQAQLNSLDPALSDIAMYARPSVVEVEGTLIMSLSAFTGGNVPERVVMIASDDHGKTWRYLGTPLTAADAKALGYVTLSGATLLKKGGRIYLAAVFGDDKVSALGTTVLSFEELGKALLQRDSKTNAPLVVNKVPRLSESPTEMGGGFAAYADACAPVGMLTGEYSGLKKSFQIFRSMRQPEEE